MQHSGFRTGLGHVFWNRHDPVVGAEGYHVVSTAHLFIEVLEQFAEILVERDQDVLNFSAAGTEFVPYIVDRGIANTQKIGRATLTQAELIDGSLRKASQVGVRVRTARPLLVKRGVGLGVHALSSQCMRESGPPSLGGPSTRSPLIV